MPLSVVNRVGSQCRLLYLVGGLGTGGLEKQLYYLLKALDRERYMPAVAVWNYCEKGMLVQQIRDLGVPLHWCSHARSRTGKLAVFRKLIRELKPEVIHSYCFYTNFAAWWASLGFQSIGIGSIRQDLLTERRVAGRILGRLSARLPDIQVANSFAAKSNAKQLAWFSRPSRIFPVRNGLDIDQFTFHPLSRGKPSLLAIGRLAPEKRWDRLLECIAAVAARGFELSVSVAGDGPLRVVLEAQARKLGVNGIVHFLGLRWDIPQLLQRATFLVHTADAEGCPNVVMEAMASGRAVVAMDAGDVSDLVDDGQTGFVIRRGDDAGLAEAIMKLLTDYDLCRRMGECGRAKAEREFKLDRLVAETLAVYRLSGWETA